ncbi:MAG: hypothetical protein NZ455_10245, partial [Bacteroidia bacterium]|nr:hypothetical protein [Bacteroidia bacterium]MDW8348294.1 hypothetical protein [Bacteroidia bacterium]
RSDSAARSTPTLPTRAQRDVGKDTPKKYKKQTYIKTEINKKSALRVKSSGFFQIYSPLLYSIT